jgi:PPIC-type PPIASE domain
MLAAYNYLYKYIVINSFMRNLLKEPLLHFVIIGALFFLVYNSINKNESENIITIDQYDVNQLIAKWELQWKVKPTEVQLDKLISRYVREEVYYREGMAMNLDHNDEIIRRRIAQKMEFLSSDIVKSIEPTNSELKNYFNENQEKYISAPKVSFKHIYFSNEKRRDAKGDAIKVLKNNFDVDNFQGDAFPYKYEYENLDRSQIIKTFGTAFTDTILIYDTLKWFGPVRSGYGYHLVYISTYEQGKDLDLSQVIDKVKVDYQYDLQVKMNESIYQVMLKKYKVINEWNEDN